MTQPKPQIATELKGTDALPRNVDANPSEAAFQALVNRVEKAVETYANVHRSAGFRARTTTALFESARKIAATYAGADSRSDVTVFCSPRRAQKMLAHLPNESVKRIAARDIGLPLGVEALVIPKKYLSKCPPPDLGGGTARLISPNRIIWAKPPGFYEAGTPPVLSAITLAVALRIMEAQGKERFGPLPATGDSRDVLYADDETAGLNGRPLLEYLKQNLMGGGAEVSAIGGRKRAVHLDAAASTPTFAPIWRSCVRAWRLSPEEQRKTIAEAKEICARFIGAPQEAYDILFFSNTTEAINVAAESIGREATEQAAPVVLTTTLEHSSNDLPWRRLPGHTVVRMGTDEEGFLDLDEMEGVLSEYNKEGRHGPKRIGTVAVSGASNVLGTCNPIAEITERARRYGARVLIDGAQLVPHRPVDIAREGVDYFTFSAHKIYAPFGVGVLAVRKGLLNFTPNETAALRASGEENVGGIAALAKALLLLERIGMDEIQADEHRLAERLLNGLARIPGVTIYGTAAPNSPRFDRKGGTIPFNLGRSMADRIARESALRGGIGLRCGCHCAHMAVKQILHVGPGLQRFQNLIISLFPKLELPGVVRAGFGLYNTTADVDALLETLAVIAESREPATPRKIRKSVEMQINAAIEQRTEKIFG